MPNMNIGTHRVNAQAGEAPTSKPAPASTDPNADAPVVIKDDVTVTFEEPITLEDLGKLLVPNADGGFTLNLPDGATVKTEKPHKA